jgi:hypothetical protein
MGFLTCVLRQPFGVYGNLETIFVFRENRGGVWLYSSKHGYDAAELGYSVSRREGGFDEYGGANQEGGFPGALDLLEVTAPLHGGKKTMADQIWRFEKYTTGIVEKEKGWGTSGEGCASFQFQFC